MLSSRELPPLLGSPPPKLHPFGNLGAEGKSSVNSSCNGSCCNKTASPQHLSGFDYGSKQLSAYSFGLDPPSSSSSSKSDAYCHNGRLFGDSAAARSLPPLSAVASFGPGSSSVPESWNPLGAISRPPPQQPLQAAAHVLPIHTLPPMPSRPGEEPNPALSIPHVPIHVPCLLLPASSFSASSSTLAGTPSTLALPSMAHSYFRAASSSTQLYPPSPLADSTGTPTFCAPPQAYAFQAIPTQALHAATPDYRGSALPATYDECVSAELNSIFGPLPPELLTAFLQFHQYHMQQQMIQQHQQQQQQQQMQHQQHQQQHLPTTTGTPNNNSNGIKAMLEPRDNFKRNKRWTSEGNPGFVSEPYSSSQKSPTSKRKNSKKDQAAVPLPLSALLQARPQFNLRTLLPIPLPTPSPTPVSTPAPPPPPQQQQQHGAPSTTQVSAGTPNPPMKTASASTPPPPSTTPALHSRITASSRSGKSYHSHPLTKFSDNSNYHYYVAPPLPSQPRNPPRPLADSTSNTSSTPAKSSKTTSPNDHNNATPGERVWEYEFEDPRTAYVPTRRKRSAPTPSSTTQPVSPPAPAKKRKVEDTKVQHSTSTSTTNATTTPQHPQPPQKRGGDDADVDVDADDVMAMDGLARLAECSSSEEVAEEDEKALIRRCYGDEEDDGDGGEAMLKKTKKGWKDDRIVLRGKKKKRMVKKTQQKEWRGAASSASSRHATFDIQFSPSTKAREMVREWNVLNALIEKSLEEETGEDGDGEEEEEDEEEGEEEESMN